MLHMTSLLAIIFEIILTCSLLLLDYILYVVHIFVLVIFPVFRAIFLYVYVHVHNTRKVIRDTVKFKLVGNLIEKFIYVT